nr:hypothetical protein [Tanacetum cinerariifolium]
MHDADMFRVDELEGNEVNVDVIEKIVEKEVSTADPVTNVGEVVTAASVEDSAAPTTATTADVDDELTLGKTLIKIVAAKPKEERIAREKDEANKVMVKEWDEVQAIIDVDRQLAEQIQAQEREQVSIEERSKLLAKLIESKRKYFAAKRAEEIRNKPPIKNVEESLKKTQVEVTEGSSKRAGQELEQESGKKQKLATQEQAKVADDDTVKLERCLETVHEDDDDDDDVSIEATPLSSKSPIVVDFKIYREGKKSYFNIIRAERNSQNYLTFGIMFKNFNREDLEVLRSIVKERLHVDYKVEMAYDLLRLIRRQINEGYKPE